MAAADPVTTADVLVPLAAAFFGAAAGGGATVWANRRELTRRQRVRIFDGLLPPIRKLLGGTEEALAANRPDTVEQISPERLDELLRAARIAGRRDHERATRIATGALAYRTQMDEYKKLPVGGRDEYGIPIPTELSPERRARLPALRQQNEAVRVAVSEFSDWLHGKV